MSPERRRVELPKELSKDVIVLSCDSTAKGGVCDIYVVGTNHMSK
ncbi:traB domain-containing protein-like, partial [Trifolium medium]|nr:traB domain-containing protein-like [Trifolium medium]